MKDMGEIYDGDLKNDVLGEIKKWRKVSDEVQSGLETFIHMKNPEEGDESQSSLADF